MHRSFLFVALRPIAHLGALLFLAALLLVACSGGGTVGNSGTFGPRPYRDHAVEIGTWLRSTVVTTADGESWPVTVEDPETIAIGIDNGVAGVVLFFLELHRVTGNDDYLIDVRRGADYLLATLPAADDDGLVSNPNLCALYSGWAGAGYALERSYAVTADSSYRDGAIACVSLVSASAVETDKGVRWNDAIGIESGSAGTGLFLLHASLRLGDPEAMKLAERVALDLLYRGERDSTGFKWPSADGAIDDGFASGGAGVGYFLATLAGATEREEYLQAALHAGERLKFAAPDTGAFTLGDPGPEISGESETAAGDAGRAYGWAYGSIGASRLFQQLAFLTGDPQWTELVDRCGLGVRDGGLPGMGAPASGRQREGVDRGRRRGSAAAAEFFLRLYQNQGEEEAADFARILVDDILGAATADETGMRWTTGGATHTGYFSGAAGAGLLLLQLDAESMALEWPMALPDDPFGLYSEFDSDRP